MCSNKTSLTYRDAGVDIDAGNRAVELMKESVKRTYTPGVVGDLGGFGGLYSLAGHSMSDPMLVSGTDGVGTKLRLAIMMDKHDTIGQDCVAMSVNDILVQGATPLFFLDYIAVGKLDPLKVADIVRGTTSGIIVKMLKEAGAKEVYMCVSSPSIEYSCHYGIDTSVRKELIAATHTVDEIKDYINADKLHYLSREGLCRAVSDIAPNDLCFACFNGDYSVEVPAEQEEGVKYVLE